MICFRDTGLFPQVFSQPERKRCAGKGVCGRGDSNLPAGRQAPTPVVALPAQSRDLRNSFPTPDFK
jgi:hypothetical protein